MSKMVQIRNVPDELHLELKIRAARAGMSLSDYLLAEVGKLVAKPTMQDWFDEVWADDPVQGDWSPADIIRELRGPLGPYASGQEPSQAGDDPRPAGDLQPGPGDSGAVAKAGLEPT